MKKIIISAILAAVLIAAAVMPASAAFDWGDSYKDAPWNCNGSGSVKAYLLDDALHIYGSGAMEYLYPLNTWGENGYFNEIFIEEGLTEISQLAFASAHDLMAVHLPSTLVSIGNNAFLAARGLYYVVYGGSEEDWAKITFAGGNDGLTGCQHIYFNGKEPTDAELKEMGYPTGLPFDPGSRFKPFEPSHGLGPDREHRLSSPAVRFINSKGEKNEIYWHTIIGAGDTIDFSHTYYSGTVIYKMETEKGLEIIGKAYTKGVTEVPASSYSPIGTVKNWKIETEDAEHGTLSVIVNSFEKGIRAEGTDGVLNIGDTLTPGQTVDFAECGKAGKVTYLAPENSGIAKTEADGQKVVLVSPENCKPAVTKWTVAAVNHNEGTLSLRPVEYEGQMTAAGTILTPDTVIFADAKIEVSPDERETAVRYYADRKDAEPLYTATVKGVFSAGVPEGFDTALKAWEIMSVDNYNGVLSLCPYGLEGGSYRLVNYREGKENTIRVSELEVGMAIENGITVVFGGNGMLSFDIADYLHSYIFGEMSPSATLKSPEGCERITAWYVSFMGGSGNSVFLHPIYEAHPEYEKYFPDPVDGEEEKPWKIGEGENDTVNAYISGKTLFVGGAGRMKNFGHAEAPWYGRNVEYLKIGDDVTYIGDNAFMGLNLFNIDFGAKVEAIGDYAFQNCEKVSSIRIPGQIKKIGAGAFCNMSSLSYLAFSVGVQEIGYGAFRGDSAINFVLYDGSEEGWKQINIKEGNERLTEGKIFFGVSSLGNGSGSGKPFIGSGQKNEKTDDQSVGYKLALVGLGVLLGAVIALIPTSAVIISLKKKRR